MVTLNYELEVEAAKKFSAKGKSEFNHRPKVSLISKFEITIKIVVGAGDSRINSDGLIRRKTETEFERINKDIKNRFSKETRNFFERFATFDWFKKTSGEADRIIQGRKIKSIKVN